MGNRKAEDENNHNAVKKPIDKQESVAQRDFWGAILEYFVLPIKFWYIKLYSV